MIIENGNKTKQKTRNGWQNLISNSFAISVWDKARKYIDLGIRQWVDMF